VLHRLLATECMKMLRQQPHHYNLGVVTPTFFGEKTLIVTITVEAGLAGGVTVYSQQVSSAGASCNGGAAGAAFSYTLWQEDGGALNTLDVGTFTAQWICTGATSGTAVQATHSATAATATVNKLLMTVLVI